MPIAMRKEEIASSYYENLTSDDIMDEIPYGETRYPVHAFCHAGEFENAYFLLKKGYHGFHEDKPDEFLAICSAILRCSNRMVAIPASERAEIPFVLECLKAECYSLGEATIYEVAEAFVTLIDGRGIVTSLLQMIRENFLPVYNAILDTEISMCLLIACQDEIFTVDYMERLKQTGKLLKYVEENNYCEEDARDELLGLMSLARIDTINECSAVLFRLSGYAKELFPDGFTTDVAVLAAIKKLRIITPVLLDDGWPEPDTEFFAENDSVKSILGKLNRLLKFHMREDYNFDRVAEVMILSCGMYGTQYDLEDDEIPQDCDSHVLEEVLKYVGFEWNMASVPVSEQRLKEVNVEWETSHERKYWRLEYDRAKPRIDWLLTWFYENCTVLPMEDEEV